MTSAFDGGPDQREQGATPSQVQIRFDLIVLAEQARAVGEQIQAELRQIAAAATRAMTLPRMW